MFSGFQCDRRCIDDAQRSGHPCQAALHKITKKKYISPLVDQHHNHKLLATKSELSKIEAYFQKLCMDIRKKIFKQIL